MTASSEPSKSSQQSNFDAAVGERRGLTDARAAVARLDIAEREMERAQQEAQRLQVEYDKASGGAAELGELMTQQAEQFQERDAELRKSRSDRDRARYALVRATGADVFRSVSAVHHGTWTPGRPYLSGEHVYDTDGRCYQAPPFGVAPEHAPGVSDSWVPCADVSQCPLPAPLPRRSHPVDARTVRQDVFWWDKDGTKYEIDDLSDEHLQEVIGWLHEHAQRLWYGEIDAGKVLVPCPAQAYLSPADWLADTPLMRALEAEAARCEAAAEQSATTAPAARSTRKRPQ